MLTFTDFIFYVFSLLLVMASAMVIVARNPVYAVLYLIFAFFNTAALFVMMGAEFLATLLVVVYVGAVAVLFLFVVMMLRIDIKSFRAGCVKFLPVSIILGIILLIELICFFVYKYGGADPMMLKFPVEEMNVQNIHQIGRVLYTDYFYLFQITGLILLVAMIAAIVLTLRQRSGVKRQNIGVQLARRPEETVELVDIPFRKGTD